MTRGVVIGNAGRGADQLLFDEQERGAVGSQHSPLLVLCEPMSRGEQFLQSVGPPGHSERDGRDRVS
jgi:hypothetical protein